MKSINAAKGYAPDVAPAGMRLALFYGQDGATATDLADKLTRRLAPGGDAMAITSFSPAQLKDDPAKLADEAAAVSMFGDRRVIRVDGADDSCVEAINLLFAAPAIENPVVMTAGALRKGSALLGAAEAAPDALCVICYEPDARDLPRLVQEIGSEVGLEVSGDAARLLIDAVNGDRLLLRRELEKCALYVDASPERRERLTAGHVAQIGAATPDTDFDALVEAVAGGKPAEADKQIRRLAAAGIPGITQLRSVARRLWLLLDLRTLVDAGPSPQQVVDAARPPIFWKTKPMVTAQLARWRTPALRAALDRILATERAIKMPGTAGDVLASQTLLAIAVQASR
jgi:DNA polymerase-3 subunit delta